MREYSEYYVPCGQEAAALLLIDIILKGWPHNISKLRDSEIDFLHRFFCKLFNPGTEGIQAASINRKLKESYKNFPKSIAYLVEWVGLNGDVHIENEQEKKLVCAIASIQDNIADEFLKPLAGKVINILRRESHVDRFCEHFLKNRDPHKVIRIKLAGFID